MSRQDFIQSKNASIKFQFQFQFVYLPEKKYMYTYRHRETTLAPSGMKGTKIQRSSAKLIRSLKDMEISYEINWCKIRQA